MFSLIATCLIVERTSVIGDRERCLKGGMVCGVFFLLHYLFFSLLIESFAPQDDHITSEFGANASAIPHC